MNFILVVDIGNSYTKMGIFDMQKNISEKIIMFETKKIIYKKFIFSKFSEFINFNITDIIVGSVVPKIKDKIIESIKIFFDVNPYLINENTKFSFNIDNNIRKEIGDDLLALSEFCVSKSNDAVGFSFGTAISSVHLENKKLSGVFISPGISFGLNFLMRRASLIGEQKINKNSNIFFGNNTKKSLEAGVNNLRRGIVLSSVYSVIDKNKSNPYCLISGGEASKIDPVDFKYEINKEAILLGFKMIYELNN